MASQLNALLARSGNSITGRGLRELVMNKWGRSYDVRLTKLQGRMYLQGRSTRRRDRVLTRSPA